ncbi:MAG: adenosylcobinamide-GDP ribazoletransferase [Alphaproteobacteria bacterium]
MTKVEFDSNRINQAARGWLREVAAALGYLLRLPRGAELHPDEIDNARARRFFPLAALAIAFAGAVAFFVCRFIGLPSIAAALFATFVMMLTTGLRAEVMLAAFAEGIAAGVDPASRRAAMAEQRFGYYGVAALLFAVLLKIVLWSMAGGSWAGMAFIFAAAPAAAAALAMLTDMFMAADDERLGGLALPEGRALAWLAPLLAFVFLLLFLGFWGAILAALMGAATAYAVGRYCRDELGGLTMPGLAAALLATELAVLAAAVIAR